MEIQRLIDCINASERTGLLHEPKGLSGYSGEKVIGLLQRCAVSLGPNEAYLEVGVYQGMSLVSVSAAASGLDCYGIDNFSQFDSEGKNKQLVLSRLMDNELDNAHLIESDYEDALDRMSEYIDKPVGLYFVDGPHDYRSQLLCLGLARNCLANRSVIIVDDSNYPHVRRANSDFLRMNPDYALVFQAYTSCHPMNKNDGNDSEHRKGWWNGINVIIHDPEYILDRTYPLPGNEKELYFNEHLVHASRYAPLSVQLVGIFGYLTGFKFVKMSRSIATLVRKMVNGTAKIQGDYLSLNVDTKEIVGTYYVSNKP